jgi:hypothetical protein
MKYQIGIWVAGSAQCVSSTEYNAQSSAWQFRSEIIARDRTTINRNDSAGGRGSYLLRRTLAPDTALECGHVIIIVM